MIMKKIFVAVAILLGAMATNAEVVSRDTVAYDGAYKVEKIVKQKDYGEVSVRYVAILFDVLTSKGEPRKVTIDKATYERGAISHLVYTNSDNGSRRIAKAVYVGTENKNQKANKQ